ncbi:MAG: DUF2283 domain-containing protein [Desulfotignum sp.]|nr:DUF2283 domain-containing protein [Desulfotignum sp.]
MHYDQEVDAAYLRIFQRTSRRSCRRYLEGVNLDLTEDGRIVGIEILDVSKNFPLQSLFTCEFDSKLIA